MNHTVKPTVLSIIPFALDFLFGCVIWPLQYPSLANRTEAPGRRCWRTFGLLSQEHGEFLILTFPRPHGPWSFSHPLPLPVSLKNVSNPLFLPTSRALFSLTLGFPDSSLLPCRLLPHSGYVGLCQCTRLSSPA